MLKNCIDCGQLFASRGGLRCPDCVRASNEAFERVREALEEHPEATLEDLVEQTGVKREQILEFLRQGRLVVRSLGPEGASRCRVCGGPVKLGSLCSACAREMQGSRRGSAGLGHRPAAGAGTGSVPSSSPAGSGSDQKIHALRRRAGR